ncbi:hypothetical protein C4588_01900, partial [Candidatus Parcubacteria bacterium]
LKEYYDDYYGDKIAFLELRSVLIKYTSSQELHRYERNIDKIVEYQEAKKIETTTSNFLSEIYICDNYASMGQYSIIYCIYLDGYILQLFFDCKQTSFDSKYNDVFLETVIKDFNNMIESVKIEIK